MNGARYSLILSLLTMGLTATLGAEPLVLTASKDTFGTSYERKRNSGKSEQLYIAHASSVRSIISFDLAEITNRIEHAVFRFQQGNTMPDAPTLVVAPMVPTKNNTAWGEGSGSMGVKGQNSVPGDANYGWSAFPDIMWESINGDAVQDLGDSQLWLSPIVTLRNLEWKEGTWIEVPFKSVEELENIRTSDAPIVTLGIWGTSGNGYYAIRSRESGHSPELVLTIEEPEAEK